RVREEDGWRVAAYAAAYAAAPWAGEAAVDATAEGAADVIRRYYAAIAAQDFRLAYSLWGDGGAASGQTLDAFSRGFEETASVVAEVGPPGRVEPAAGSRYVQVPVVVHATTAGGEEQRFEGTYTLRRSVVDGATDRQRRWHIASAEVVRVR